MTDTWTIRQVLNWTTGRFKDLDIPTALLDAQLLLCAALSLDKISLYTQMDRPLSLDERAVLKDFVKRRMAGEPVAYMLSQKHWHNLDLFVDARVLIPRPETETMLDIAIDVGKNKPELASVIFDFCTGSGCLALALAQRFPKATVVGIDISQDAIDVAEHNKQRNKIENAKFELFDVTNIETIDALLAKYGSPTMIVANPPYVREDEWTQLDITVSRYEPRLALVAGSDGLQVAIPLVRHLRQRGVFDEKIFFAMELAEAQPRHMAKVLTATDAFTGLDAFVNHELLPLQTFFGMRDLENRERFLCYLKN